MGLFVYRITVLKGIWFCMTEWRKSHSSDMTSQEEYDEVLEIGNECTLYRVITNQL